MHQVQESQEKAKLYRHGRSSKAGFKTPFFTPVYAENSHFKIILELFSPLLYKHDIINILAISYTMLGILLFPS